MKKVMMKARKGRRKRRVTKTDLILWISLVRTHKAKLMATICELGLLPIFNAAYSGQDNLIKFDNFI